MHSLLVIGCGSIGERHLRSFKSTGRAKVTACDANLTLLGTVAQTYGVHHTSDWQKAVASGEFSAAVICTPAHLHVRMATEALHHGLHVLVEKPLSQSLEGIGELLEARNISCRHVSVAYVLHVDPLLIEVRDFLTSGEYGAIREVTSTSGQYFPGGRPAHSVHYSRTYYRDRATGGGAIQDALTHMANWVEGVIGPADSVLCDCGHQALPGVEVEDTVHVSARHGDIMVNYTLNQFQAPDESTLQFNTASGSVKVEFHLHRWGTYRLGDSGWTWRSVPPGGRDTPFIHQAQRFLDAIEGKPSQLCTLEAAVQTLRFNLASLASAELGARVHCAAATVASK